MSRPHIIFLMSDQQRWDALGRVNPLIKTPHLDALSDSGIHFDQAVCQAPMCVPSRYSMMLGQYSFQTGVRNNGQSVSEDIGLTNCPLPEALKEQGYRTLGFGKTHWYDSRMENKPSDRGFDQLWHARKNDDNLYPEKTLTWHTDEPEAFAAWVEEQKILPQGGESLEGYMGYRSQLPATHHREGWLTRKCLETLEAFDPATETEPLFIYFSLDFPHAGLYVPAEYEDIYDLDDIAERPQAPWHRMEESHRPLGHIINFHTQWKALSSEERRMATLRYYAATTYIDDCFGQVLNKLEEKGILENSLIVMTSDHGEMLGDRDHRFSKYCLYEGSVRVPLILAGSVIDDEKRGSVDSRCAELIDIYPTLTQTAGAEARPELPGISLLNSPGRLGQFCEMDGAGGRFEPSQRGPALMWRTPEWKLIIHQQQISLGQAAMQPDQIKGELYDLQADPYECTNLYQNPAYRDQRESMTVQLLMHIAQQNARWPRRDSVLGLEYNPPEEIEATSPRFGVKYWY